MAPQGAVPTGLHGGEWMSLCCQPWLPLEVGTWLGNTTGNAHQCCLCSTLTETEGRGTDWEEMQQGSEWRKTDVCT